MDIPGFMSQGPGHFDITSGDGISRAIGSTTNAKSAKGAKPPDAAFTESFTGMMRLRGQR